MAELPNWNKLVDQTEHDASVLVSLPPSGLNISARSRAESSSSMISEDDILVYVRNTREVHEPNSMHVLYEIELKQPSSQIEWSVHYRYSHVVQFRDKLLKKYTNNLVKLPPLPPKTIFSTPNNNWMVNRRKQAFELFFQWVVREKKLQNDEDVSKFLHLEKLKSGQKSCILAIDSNEATVVVQLHVDAKSEGLAETACKIKSGTTAEQLAIQLANKLQITDNCSLFEISGGAGENSTFRVNSQELILDRIQKWYNEKTDRSHKLLLRSNVEYIRFWLAKSPKTYFTFRITDKTLNSEITELLSERYDIEFSIYEQVGNRKVAPEEKLYFVYNSWKSANRFILKQEGPRVTKAEPESIALTVGEDKDRTIPRVKQLRIDDKCKIDLSKLKLQKHIGGGSFGKVYVGTYKNKPVAVKKIINTTQYPMDIYVQRELDILQKLPTHPNVIEFCGALQTENAVWIVTEFIARGDLRNLLSDKAVTLSWELRLSIALDVALALQHLHSSGVVHRDLKSDNLLVQNDFRVKLCDFGLARESNAPRMTLVGTPDWLAPEVIMGEEEGPEGNIAYSGSRADIFSFGMVLTELITRKTPPLRNFDQKYVFPEKVFKDNVPNDAPFELVDLCLKCVQNNPNLRPDIKEIQRLLSSVDTEKTVDSELKKVAPKFDKPKKPGGIKMKPSDLQQDSRQSAPPPEDE